MQKRGVSFNLCRIILLAWLMLNIVAMPLATAYNLDSSIVYVKEIGNERVNQNGWARITVISNINQNIAERDVKINLLSSLSIVDEGTDGIYTVQRQPYMLISALFSILCLMLVMSYSRKFNKRGQITLFVIIGLVLVAGFGFVYYISTSIAEKEMQTKIDKITSDMLQATAFEYYTGLCLDKATKDGLKFIGAQGGYLYLSQGGFIPESVRPYNSNPLVVKSGSLLTEYDVTDYDVSYGVTRPYLGVENYEHGWYRLDDYSTQPMRGDFGTLDSFASLCNPLGPNRIGLFIENYFPCESAGLYNTYGLNSIQEQLREYITTQTKECVNFTSFSEELGATITEGNLSANVTLGENDVSVTLNYPIVIQIGENLPVTEFLNFDTNIKVRLKKVYDLAHHLLLEDAEDLYFVVDEFTNISSLVSYQGEYYWLPGMEVSKIRNVCTECVGEEKYDDVLVILDNESLIDGNPYLFQVGIQNRIPVLSRIRDLGRPDTEKYDIIRSEGDPITISPHAYDPDDDSLTFVYSGWKQEYDEEFNFTCCKPHGNVECDIDLSPCMIKHHNRRLYEWNNSESFVRTGVIADYRTKRKDIGEHEVTVTVFDDGGLKDWQIVKILVKDRVIANINTTSIYNDTKPFQASIEDPFRLDASRTGFVLGTPKFEWKDMAEGISYSDIYSAIKIMPDNLSISSITREHFTMKGDHLFTLTIDDGVTSVESEFGPVVVHECLPHRSSVPIYPFNERTAGSLVDSLSAYQGDHTCCIEEAGDYIIKIGNCFEYHEFSCYPLDPNLEYAPADLAVNDTSDGVIGNPYSLEFIEQNRVHLPSGFSDNATNDIFKREFVQACGHRGNVCSGTINDSFWDHQIPCNDYADRKGEDEACQGPCQDCNSLNCPVRYSNETRVMGDAPQCYNYTPGESFELNFIKMGDGDGNIDGHCNNIWRCSNASSGVGTYNYGVSGVKDAWIKNPDDFICLGQCDGEGGCSWATNCFDCNDLDGKERGGSNPFNYVGTGPFCGGECYSKSPSSPSTTTHNNKLKRDFNNNDIDTCYSKDYICGDLDNSKSVTATLLDENICSYVYADLDYSERLCEGCESQGTRWVQCGESDCTSLGDYQATGERCCGDDIGEWPLECKKSPLNKYACPTSDNLKYACCDDPTDCVDKGKCYDSEECHVFSTSRKSYCFQGTWYDADEKRGYCEDTDNCNFGWYNEDGNGDSDGITSSLDDNCCGDDMGDDNFCDDIDGGACVAGIFKIEPDSDKLVCQCKGSDTPPPPNLVNNETRPDCSIDGQQNCWVSGAEGSDNGLGGGECCEESDTWCSPSGSCANGFFVKEGDKAPGTCNCIVNSGNPPVIVTHGKKGWVQVKNPWLISDRSLLNGGASPISGIEDGECCGDDLTEDTWCNRQSGVCDKGIYYEDADSTQYACNCITDPNKDVDAGVCTSQGQQNCWIPGGEWANDVNGNYGDSETTSGVPQGECCGDDSSESWCFSNGFSSGACSDGRYRSIADSNQKACNCITGQSVNKTQCEYGDSGCWVPGEDGEHAGDGEVEGGGDCCGDDSGESWCVGTNEACEEGNYYIKGPELSDPDDHWKLCECGTNTGNTWRASPDDSDGYECCGDDPNDYFNGTDSNHGVDGCCCNGEMIYDDSICNDGPSGKTWCLDGRYCYEDNKIVSEETNNQYIVALGDKGFDNIECGCYDNREMVCDSDRDTIADGMCVVGDICHEGSMYKKNGKYYKDCELGYECDSKNFDTFVDIPWDYEYHRDGTCVGSAANKCCTTQVVSGDMDNANYDGSGDESCGCTASTKGMVCDSDPSDNSGWNGICAQESSGTYVCDSVEEVVFFGSNYFTNCEGHEGEGCMDVNTANNLEVEGYVRTGYCKAGVCVLGDSIVKNCADSYSGNSCDDLDQIDIGCGSNGGWSCDDSGGDYFSRKGICVDTGYNSPNCDKEYETAKLSGGYYGDCVYLDIPGGNPCHHDSSGTNSDFIQDGICTYPYSPSSNEDCCREDDNNYVRIDSGQFSGQFRCGCAGLEDEPCDKKGIDGSGDTISFEPYGHCQTDGGEDVCCENKSDDYTDNDFIGVVQSCSQNSDCQQADYLYNDGWVDRDNDGRFDDKVNFINQDHKDRSNYDDFCNASCQCDVVDVLKDFDVSDNVDGDSYSGTPNNRNDAIYVCKSQNQYNELLELPGLPNHRYFCCGDDGGTDSECGRGTTCVNGESYLNVGDLFPSPDGNSVADANEEMAVCMCSTDTDLLCKNIPDGETNFCWSDDKEVCCGNGDDDTWEDSTGACYQGRYGTDGDMNGYVCGNKFGKEWLGTQGPCCGDDSGEDWDSTNSDMTTGETQNVEECCLNGRLLDDKKIDGKYICVVDSSTSNRGVLYSCGSPGSEIGYTMDLSNIISNCESVGYGTKYYCDDDGSDGYWRTEKENGCSCNSDTECDKFCDNDGVGALDDGRCYQRVGNYFDFNEPDDCEFDITNDYSVSGIAVECDEITKNTCDTDGEHDGFCTSTCTLQGVGDSKEGCACVHGRDVSDIACDTNGIDNGCWKTSHGCCSDELENNWCYSAGKHMCLYGIYYQDPDSKKELCDCVKGEGYYKSGAVGNGGNCCDNSNDYFDNGLCCWGGQVLDSGETYGKALCASDFLFVCGTLSGNEVGTQRSEGYIQFAEGISYTCQSNQWVLS